MKAISQKTSRKNEAGFTLVELAVVLIIIGLLVGGVLKGQELIESARMKSTLSQVDTIRLAVQSFQDKYGAYPGDIINPGNILSDCGAAPCNNAGDGDDRIEHATSALGTAPSGGGGSADEQAVAFFHMNKAGLLKSMSATDQYLDAKIGGVFWVGYSSGSAVSVSSMRAGHYIVLTGAVADVGTAGSGLTGAQAAQIDRALDDGNPTTGTVYGSSGANCVSSNAYVENSDEADCSLYIGL